MNPKDEPPRTTLLAFIKSVPGIAARIAEERCGAPPNEKRMEEFLRSFMNLFDKPARKKIIETLVVREDVSAEELLRYGMSQFDSRRGAVMVPFDPGELSEETLKSNAACAIVAMLCNNILIPIPPQEPHLLPPDPVLIQEIDFIIKLRETLTKGERKNYVVSPEAQQNLLSALSDSIIDPAHLMKVWETGGYEPHYH